MNEIHNMNGPGNGADADPIARNPKDVDDPAQAVQSLQVVRRSESSVLAPDAALLPGQAFGAGPPVQAAPSMGELITSVLRFKWTIIVVFVLVCTPIIPVIWTQITPKYQARAELRIRPYIPHLVFKTEDTGTVPFYDSFVNTQVSVMRSPKVLQRVLDQSEVQETQWYKNPAQSLVQRLLRNPPVPPLERLRDSLSVSPRRMTEITDVRFTDVSRQEAILIVSAVLDQYMAYSSQRFDETKDSISKRLKGQYDSLKAEIDGRENILAGLRKSLGTDTPQELVAMKRFNLDWTQNRLGELQQAIVLSEWERTKLAAAVTQSASGDSNDIPIVLESSPSTQGEYTESELCRKFVFDLKAMTEQIAKLGSSLGAHAPPDVGVGEGTRLDQTRDCFRQLQQSVLALDADRMQLEHVMTSPIADDANAIDLERVTQDAAWRRLAFDVSTVQRHINGLSRAWGEQGTQTPTDGVADNAAETKVHLSELRQHIAVLEWDRMKIEDMMIQALQDEGHEVLVDSDANVDKRQQYYEDAEWRKLDSSIRAMQHQLDNSVYGPNHPEMTRMVRDIEFSRESLLLREAQIDRQWHGLPKNLHGPITVHESQYEARLKSLDYQLERQRQEEQLQQASFDAQKKAYDDLFARAQTYNNELIQLEHKRGLFESVRQRQDQRNMERNSIGKIEQLTGAFAASQPSQDRRIVFTIMTLFMGLGAGGGIAFLRAMSNQDITRSDRMPHPMQAPFLGCIPLIRKGQPLDYEVSPAMTEAVRAVRTALLTRLNGRSGSTLVVTSSTEGTGKSNFTVILGKSIAQTGKKVLMIDADFHKMTLTRRFGLLDKGGLIESLRSRAKKRRKHVIPTETSNLSVMAAGKLPGGNEVLEVMSNGCLRSCIDILIEQYDIILLDSPPILPVADAPILVGQLDGAIMVERENVSQRSGITDALARLHAAGGRLLGTVFVGSFGHSNYSYGAYYRYGYGGHNGKATKS